MHKLVLIPIAAAALAACGDAGGNPAASGTPLEHHAGTVSGVALSFSGAGGTVSWAAMTGAAKYQVEIVTACDAAFSVAGNGNVGADLTEYTLSMGNAPGGSYIARVRSTGQGNTGTFTHWGCSAPANYTTIAAVPANHAPASVDFAVPAGAVEGSAVSFQGTATDADGDPLTYAWSFGDAGTGTGASASHTYADDGAYSVTLTVSDGQAQAQVTKTVAVANALPQVTAAGNALTAISGMPYSFAGSFSDAGANDSPWTHSIDWGDGSPGGGGTTGAQGAVAGTHTFYAATGRTIVLSVTDKDGGTGTAAGVSVTVLRRAASVQVNPRSVKLSQSSSTDMMSVRVFGTADFAASTAVVSTLRLNGAAAVRGAVDDANGDGIPDVVAHFRRADVALGTGAMEVLGDLADGTQFQGTDTIRIIQ